MDRNYYYRILGLTEGATTQQIKQAYEIRMEKLKSADYRDDPEYVEKKKRQATEAYRVLTGSMPAASSMQRKARFENFKDFIEMKEGGNSSDEESPKKSFQKMRYTPKTSAGNKKYITVVLIIIVIVIISVVGSVIAAIGSFVNDIDFDLSNNNWFDSSHSSDIDYDDEYHIDQTWEWLSEIDYYKGLDMEAMDNNAGNVQWDYGTGAYGNTDEGDTTFDKTLDVLFDLEIYSVSDFFSYVTDEYDYYIVHDDYECAETLISWMGAPDFEEIAGSVNMYSGEPILTIADYLDYLKSVIDEYK